MLYDSAALQVFFIVGEFALVVVAVIFPSWRGQFAAGAVLTAASLGLWPLLPESGRWLYVQGHTQQALQVRAVQVVLKWGAVLNVLLA